MENERHKFDETLKNALGDFAPEPSAKVWKSISCQLAWKEFVQFDFSNFTHNLYQLTVASLAGAALVLSGVLYLNREPSIEKQQAGTSQPQYSDTLTNETNLPLPKETSTLPLSQPILKPTITAFKQNIAPAGLKLQEIIGREITSSQRSQHAALPVMPIIPFKDESLYALSDAERKPTLPPSSHNTDPDILTHNLGIHWAINRMTLPDSTNNYNYSFTSLGVEYRIDYQKLRIGIGIGYQRLFDRVPYNLKFKTYDSVGFIYNVHYYMPNPQEPDNIILITTKETLYDSVSHSVLNYTIGAYDYLTIPLYGGYKILDFGNLSFGLNIHTTFQILLKSHESLPSIHNSLKNTLTLEATVPQRRKLLFDAGLGLNIEYLFRKHYGINVQPCVRMWTSPLSTGSGLKLPYAWGLETGLFYKF